MKSLIILRGNSGSGKTTVARELQNRFGSSTMLLSQDVVRRDILKTGDGKDTLALPLLTEMLRFGNRNCEIVILEGILRAEWYRPLFETAAALYPIGLSAYYFDLPFEETLRRHRTRPICGEFGEAEMRQWWVEKDYSDVLKETRIGMEQEKEQIVSDIFDAVMSR